MKQQDHGRDAFIALLRKAAGGTEAPLAAWSRTIGTLVNVCAAGQLGTPARLFREEEAKSFC